MSGLPIPQDIKKTAIKILSHFQDNPDAKDTLDGIQQWWLTSSLQGPEKRKIKQALEWLVAERLILQRTPPEPKPLYFVNRDHMKKINKLLEKELETMEENTANE